jgi:BCD family chlorophyll transporter-like MFS transporter
MNRIGHKLMDNWVRLGPRFMPFADVATADVPLGRLLRLSLFQVSVGMALVLLVGTLNRVMIVELGVPAAVVGLMLALPLLFAPFRALVGFRSDVHRCALGWRRVPFIWKGTLLQFGGFAIMPFALLVLAGKGQAAQAPAWIGQAAAATAFLLVGAGVHVVQTAGLALATDLAAPESRPRVVGLMYVMLLLGMLGSALLFGAVLSPFNPARLVAVVQGTAVLTVALNGIALWQQETRRPVRSAAPASADPGFAESWAAFRAGDGAMRRLTVVGIGTMAFGMADILLEPFGGQVLGLDVAATTRLTALLALGGLLGFGHASRVLGRGGDPQRMTLQGALIGVPAFLLVIASAPAAATGLFLVGNFLIGFGGAVFGHATLTATMNRAPLGQAGLALGAWGAVQATAAGIAVALASVLRDVLNATAAAGDGLWGLPVVANGYFGVYALEIGFLILTIAALVPMLRRPAVPSETPRSAIRAEAGRERTA